jgi:hypothetical protein
MAFGDSAWWDEREEGKRRADVSDRRFEKIKVTNRSRNERSGGLVIDFY